MPSVKRLPATNRLLAALPRQAHDRVLAKCDQVQLAFADVLYRPGKRISYVYFPTEGMVSLVTPPLSDAAGLEVGLIGNEGMVGTPVLMGVAVSSLLALVQGAGTAWRMSAASFCRALQQNRALKQGLDRYECVTSAQFAHMAACNRFHVLPARLARWLLMTHDRAHLDTFHITHQFLGFMLGSRRVGVTEAANLLRNQKLIEYHRGYITVLDRQGLEAASCTCYHRQKEIYDALLN